MRVSPEGLTTAFVMAVAMDIKRSEPMETLRQWKRMMLSTPCRFAMLPSSMQRYWYALAMREDITHQYEVCQRSCYQRVHEVVRLTEKMRETIPRSQETAAAVEAEYNKNLKSMHEKGSGPVTANFVDVALTVARRMMSVPEIATLMRDADARGPSEFNPWGSHSRLQAMIDKCRTKEAWLWCCEALAYVCSRKRLQSLSFAEIKGTAHDGN